MSAPLFAVGDLVELHRDTQSILMLRDGASIEDTHAWVLVDCGSIGIVLRSYDISVKLGSKWRYAYDVQFGGARVTSVFETELRAV